MDDLEQALDCFRNALRIKQKTLPPTHPSISATLNNMGIVYRKEGDYNKALICYTQALQIEQTTLSSGNLDLADTYNNLCTLYYDKSDYENALEMARCKLSILKKNFDDNDEQVKSTKEAINQIIEEIKQPSNSSFEVYF
jgi:tetratricopeptide (TPR) repeat protein